MIEKEENVAARKHLIIALQHLENAHKMTKPNMTKKKQQAPAKSKTGTKSTKSAKRARVNTR